MHVVTWLHDTGATSTKKQETSRSHSGRAFDSSRAAPGVSASLNSTDAGSEEALIDSLLLRPFLAGYSHEAELSNKTSYYRTSFATPLPKRRSISLYPFYWHKRCHRSTRAVQTHHFMYRPQRSSTLSVNSGTDVTFMAYRRRKRRRKGKGDEGKRNEGKAPKRRWRKRRMWVVHSSPDVGSKGTTINCCKKCASQILIRIFNFCKWQKRGLTVCWLRQ